MKKTILFILMGVSVFSAGCTNKDKLKSVSSDYSYNVIADNNDLTMEERTKKDITEIYNVSRGYINSWNRANTTYMNIIIDDIINGIEKDKYIKQYRKDAKRIYMKKYIDTIEILEYKGTNAKVKVINSEKKSQNIVKSPYPECKETLILTLIYKDNRWLITNINND